MNLHFHLSILAIFIVSAYCSGSYEPKVFLDVKSGDEYLGRIEIGLFGIILPKTVKNFYELCQRPVGEGYEGSKFHWVKKNFIVESGFNHGHGESIYGYSFKDENFKVRHYGAGWVSMSNGGKYLNGTRFFITLTATSSLDGRHVVFGKVLKGMDVVRRIENADTDQRDRPLVDIIIHDCTVEEVDEPFGVSTKDAD